ncbi:MAG: radical SAM protein [Clostridia bacterium]|nr:radical SAM protein [Clostridia bacterium]MDH7572957.1 radical SAM protein [Clostridia bacterium]
MLSLSKLLCDHGYYGDGLRYDPATRGASSGARRDTGPVVVWNCTRACNLRCGHCYAAADPRPSPAELTTTESRALIDDLAGFRVPALLLSGGEPLLRPDIFDLIGHAAGHGLRVVLSTNGTLIGREVADDLRRLGVSYVGISLDGLEDRHDLLRGRPGAFAAALEAFRHCREVGLRSGLRLTLTRNNLDQLPAILDLAEQERISRICIYHLVYSGRGRELADQDLAVEQKREVLDLLISRVYAWDREQRRIEVLTVDNHADGPFVYLRLRARDPSRAAEALELLHRNGGNRSGVAIAAIDWEGKVHPDQFTLHHTVGDVRREGFARIWTQAEHPLLAALRDRRRYLKGRCQECIWLEICNGNCRARAEALTGDFWAPDPACYLTEAETGGSESVQNRL